MTCALWYIRRGSVGYRLFEDEIEAAKKAHDFCDSDYAAVLGVQRDDGSIRRREDWYAFGVEERRRNAAMLEPLSPAAARPVRTKVETRIVRDPFENHHVHILSTEPEWLGVEGAGLRR